jgi:hypothetical protein
MSTRSHICIKNADGSITRVYCHSDGYPSDQMPTLTESYGTEEKIRKLISKGGFSYLAENIDEVPYYADRGEEIDIVTYKDIHEYLEFFKSGDLSDIEYLYIWCDGTWTCASGCYNINPLDCFGKDGKISGDYTGELPSYPFDKWVATYFENVPEEPQVAFVAPRLSKEEWLKQNYPHLSELPKWRFPGLAG